MENISSPYLLIFRDTAPENYKAMSADQTQKLLEQWNSWYDGLAEQGKVTQGHPLESQIRVVSGARGERVVDGPFAETKEAIGGYFMLMVADIEEATAIAQRCPNLPHGMTVEIRPVSECCHLAQTVGRTSMREPSHV